MSDQCTICGSIRGLDRHHIIPRSHGGRKSPQIHTESNLILICRTCHRKIHDEVWSLDKTSNGIQVIDKVSGRRVMRRLHDSGFDAPRALDSMNYVESLLAVFLELVPFFDDDQLVEAYNYSSNLGKRSWLLKAAILFEAQQRSIYGDQSLSAIARHFHISLRQAQKYALVWKHFFQDSESVENVNIDAIVLDEPSWYVIAATETNNPDMWLAYAQDRKLEYSGYTVASFRRDIRIARWNAGAGDIKQIRHSELNGAFSESWLCPWVQLLCTRSGKPTPNNDCLECEFRKTSRVDNELEEDNVNVELPRNN